MDSHRQSQFCLICEFELGFFLLILSPFCFRKFELRKTKDVEFCKILICKVETYCSLSSISSQEVSCSCLGSGIQNSKCYVTTSHTVAGAHLRCVLLGPGQVDAALGHAHRQLRGGRGRGGGRWLGGRGRGLEV